jgi:hypothetical protein
MRHPRHPIRAIREPFGTAGLIVACVALIAALGGSALAANGALSGKQKKEVEKIAKKFSGKPGANGANGSNGAAGAKGDSGTGAEGKQGAEGKAGKEGKEGSPWTAGGTLPSGKTETGTWTAPSEGPNLNGIGSISFAVPLAAALDEEHVFLIRLPGAHEAEVEGLKTEVQAREALCPTLAGTAKTECEATLAIEKGNLQAAEASLQAEEEAEANNCIGTVEIPQAAKGDLCLYSGRGAETPREGKGIYPAGGPLNVFGAGRSGALVLMGQESGLNYGTWAVTAP